jgi:hypothetical protein
MIPSMNLTAYKDTREDAMITPMIGPMMMALHAMDPDLVIRDLMECGECGHDCLHFVARDYDLKQVVFGGVICTNVDCTVMFVNVSQKVDL